MFARSLPYGLPLLLIAVLTGRIAIHAFNRHQQPGAVSLGWLMASMTLWTAAYAVEIIAPALATKVLAASIVCLSSSATAVFWLLFALDYTGHSNWLGRGSRYALYLLPFAAFGLAWTNESHHLIWDSASLYPSGDLSLYGEPRIWFWVCAILCSGLVVAGIWIHLWSASQLTKMNKQNSKLLALSALLPLVAGLSSLFIPRSILQGLNLAPFALAIPSIVFAIQLRHFNFLDVKPGGVEAVRDSLREAVIVLDDQKRLVNLNEAARRWLNLEGNTIGRNLQELIGPLAPILQHWDSGDARMILEVGEDDHHRLLEVSLSHLQIRDGESHGRVIVAREISRKHLVLEAEPSQFHHVEILNSIGRSVLETSEWPELLDTLTDRLSALLEADGASVVLWDEARGHAIPTAAQRALRDAPSSIPAISWKVALTESILHLNRPLPIEDVRNTPYISHPVAAQLPVHSILAVPLIVNGQKLGAALIAFNQHHHFTAQEISIAEQAASQVALALNKARLLADASRRVGQLALLQDVSRQIVGSLDETEICERAVQAITAVFGYAEAAVSLLVKDDLLELKAIAGTMDMGFTPGYLQKIGSGIIGRVAETREPYFTDDLISDPYYFSFLEERTGSAMGIPLLHEGELIGVLYVESLSVDSFIPDDRQTLEALASHLVTAILKARLYAEAREHGLSMATLQSVSETVTSTLDIDKVFNTVLQLLKDRFKYDYISIYLLEEDQLRLGGQVGYPAELVLYKIPLGGGVTGRAARTGKVQFIRDVSTDPDFLRASYEVSSEICVPLTKDGKVLGILNIEASSGRPLTEKDVDLLSALAGPVAMAIDNARLHARVLSLALTDGMTGLMNRRAFDQLLDTELARAARYEHALSLIIIDLDSFKAYNDTYGHPAGDERLKAIAEILRENVRDPDAAARYGGEEFAVILPHTTKQGAIALAERLREKAQAGAPGSKSGDDAPIAGYTISLGVATFPENGQDATQLLVAADNAEIRAKRLGKNRVCDAGTSPEGLL